MGRLDRQGCRRKKTGFVRGFHNSFAAAFSISFQKEEPWKTSRVRSDWRALKGTHMFVLFFGIAAIVGTVVLGACGSESWLCFWDGMEEAPQDGETQFAAK